MSSDAPLIPLISPNASRLAAVVAQTAGALLVMNYFAGVSLLSFDRIIPALAIGVLFFFISMYLPGVENYVQSNY